MLRRHGHEVFTAYSGREGIALHKERRPHFTLLDLHLPDMNGIEVLTRIRESDPKAAVMILTGAGSDKMERQARDLGVTDFLIKGLAPEVLIEAVARAVQPASPGSGDRTPRALHDESILVVDDERQICELLKKYLTQRGLRVHTAQDGPSALSLAELERPQLIVLDIRMPGMNGVDVLRQLRARNYQGGVMMLTGSQDENLLKEALDLGAVDIVDKPADLERIGLAIEVSLILAKKPGAKTAG
jgi:two-component system response regulator (stage 0 sporulation protein F)